MTYEELHNKLKEKFKELYGKPNIKLYASKYFIPSSEIFIKRLSAAVLQYNLDNTNRIESVLNIYIKQCISSKFPKYTKTLEYYIYGQNGKDSRLADDYENYEILEEELVEEKQYKSIIK